MSFFSAKTFETVEDVEMSETASSEDETIEQKSKKVAPKTKSKKEVLQSKVTIGTSIKIAQSNFAPSTFNKRKLSEITKKESSSSSDSSSEDDEDVRTVESSIIDEKNSQMVMTGPKNLTLTPKETTKESGSSSESSSEDEEDSQTVKTGSKNLTVTPKLIKKESSNESESSSEDEEDLKMSKTADKNLTLTQKPVEPMANPAEKSSKKRKRKRQPKNKNKLPKIELEKMAANIPKPDPKVEILSKKQKKLPLPSQASQWHASQNGNQVPSKLRPDPKHKFFEDEVEEIDVSQISTEIVNNDAAEICAAKSTNVLLLSKTDDATKKVVSLPKNQNFVPKYAVNSEEITCEQVSYITVSV